MSWFELVYDRQLQGLWSSLTSNREKCNSHQCQAQAGHPHDLFTKHLQNLLPCEDWKRAEDSYYQCTCRTLLYFTFSNNLFMGMQNRKDPVLWYFLLQSARSPIFASKCKCIFITLSSLTRRIHPTWNVKLLSSNPCMYAGSSKSHTGNTGVKISHLI